MTVRLRGTDLPDGEITLAGLSALSGSLQLLSTRIGRLLAGQHGPGRSRGASERATRLRLRGLRAGSTVLQVTVGEDDVLDDGFEQQTLDRVFEVFDGMAAGVPPPWATPLVGDAVVQVLTALESVSRECDVSRDDTIRSVSFAPARSPRQVWTSVPDAPATLADTRVSGTLDVVNLRSGQFRLSDDVGNDIRLDDVENAAFAARLVGDRVTAVGEAVVGVRGEIVRLLGTEILGAVQLPDGVLPSGASAARAVSTSPPDSGVSDVTDAELDEFLSFVRGG